MDETETVDIKEADKPFVLAIALVGAWIGLTAVAALLFRDIELAKFVAGAFGPAAGMGYGFYLTRE